MFETLRLKRGVLLARAAAVDAEDYEFLLKARTIRRKSDALDAAVAEYERQANEHAGLCDPYTDPGLEEWCHRNKRRLDKLKDDILSDDEALATLLNEYEADHGEFLKRMDGVKESINHWEIALRLWRTAFREALGMKETGDCSGTKHGFLQTAVNTMCDPSILRACTASLSCSQLRDRRQQFVNCAQARDAINSECYEGGDEGHSTAASDTWRAAKSCEDLIQSNCAGAAGFSPEPWVLKR